MYLRVAGGPFSENVFREIEALTDRALVHCDGVRYDQEMKLVVIPITRYPIKKRRKLLGRITPYAKEMTGGLSSLVTVRNVVKVETANNLARDENQDVTVLFGLVVKDETVHFSSAEESRGTLMFSMDIHVSGLDLEIADT